MTSPLRPDVRDIRNEDGRRGLFGGGCGGDEKQVSDSYRTRRKSHIWSVGIFLL